VKAAVDILIPGNLIWQLRKTRSPLRSTQRYNQLGSMVEALNLLLALFVDSLFKP
jgi:hypothetical protein